MNEVTSNATDFGFGLRFNTDACNSRKSFASKIDLTVIATVQKRMVPNIMTDATDDIVGSPPLLSFNLWSSILLLPDDTIFGG